MAGESEKRLAGAAAMLFESARSLEHVSEKLESIAETQAAATDRLIDALEKMGTKSGASKSGGNEKGFKSFAGDISNIVKALEKYDKVKDAGAKFVDFLKEFDKVNFKKIEEGGTALKSMASGLAAFGLALVASAAVFAIAAIGSIIVVPMIAGYAYLFFQLGQASKEIDAGAKVLAWMGLGLVAFGLGLFAVKELAGGDWGEFAKGSLIMLAGITAFSLAFYFVGKVAKEIEEGAKALAWSGLALVSLALGIAAFQFFKVDMGSVMVAAGAIALTGLAFGLVGLASGYIEAGAESLGFAGISLAVLALGLAAFSLLGMTLGETLATVGVVTAVGLAFAGAGFLSPLILFGAASLLVAGVALIALAGGLAVMNAVYSKAMSGLLAPSTIDPGATNLETVIGSVSSAFFINPVKSAFMLAGAAALIVASVALITLSGGVLAFNFAYNRAKDGVLAQSAQDPTMSNMDVAITGIVSAFNINPIKSAFMLVGAAALIVASVAMITMTGGILAFNFAYKKATESGLFASSAMDPKISNFEYMMNSLAGGLILGPIRLVGLYAAIPAWLTAGFALMSIGAGVAGFARLVEKEINVDKIDGMIKKVLTTVLDVFTSIGSGDAVDWDSVEEGISSVSDVGNLLNGIAQGVSKMAELKFPMYDAAGNITGYFTIADKAFDQVATNMKLIINAVAGTLVEVGKSNGESGWFSKSAGEKGADAIRGIGADLVGIADFVQKAANLTFPVYDATGKQTGVITLDPAMLDKGGLVYQNIIRMIQAVSGALGEIGSGESASSGWFSDSDIEKGKMAIAGVSGDLNGIAQMVQSVAQVKDIDTVEKNIRRILIVIPEALVAAAQYISKNKAIIGSNDIGKSFGDILDKMTESADPITKLAKGFEGISKSMEKFSKTFQTMKLSAVKTFDNLIGSLVTFSKVDPKAFDTIGTRAQELYKFVYEKNVVKVAEKPSTVPAPANAVASLPGEKPVSAAKPSTQSAQQAETISQLTQMFSEMSTNMANLAGSMKRIEAVLSGTLKVSQQ